MPVEEREERLDVRPGVRATAWIVGGMFLASAAAWIALPEGARIAVHWGLDGRPDRFASKSEALLALPLSALLLGALLAAVPRLDPRPANVARSHALYRRAWIGSLLVHALLHGAILAAALGIDAPVDRLAVGATALLVAAIGDVLGKSRSNFVAGIRTPWTLSSDLAWEKTHRWTGRLLVAVSLLAAAAALALPLAFSVALLVGGTFGAIGAGVVLSYFFWKRDPERADRGA